MTRAISEDQKHSVDEVIYWQSSAGWQAYFPGEDENAEENFDKLTIVLHLVRYFSSSKGRRFLLSNNFFKVNEFNKGEKTSFYIASNHFFSEINIEDAREALIQNPDETLACIGLAAARASEKLNQKAFNFFLPTTNQERLWPRIEAFEPITPLKEIRATFLNHFVGIKGRVVRVGSVRMQLLSMDFQCARCSTKITKTFTDYKYSQPQSCSSEACKSMTFIPIRESAATIDSQKIRIQEKISDDNELDLSSTGRMPRTIDAELLDDMIDSCVPGDSITAFGIIRVINVDAEPGTKGKSRSCYFNMYLDVNSIKNDRDPLDATSGDSQADDHFTEEELEAFGEIRADQDTFSLLVHSLVPSIFGHELIKAGILLSLFGGCPPPNSASDLTTRSDIHVLIVGDPGLGKSKILKATAAAAPRGIYVCGNTTSNAGLTVAVSREPGTGGFALEAGALVLADKGTCCIDEFDKIGAEYMALLEGMEQQSVSVAKAGMLCNLNARSCVVAAANPVGGHYNKRKTVNENLKIPMPLLSRFDLIFIIVDKPNLNRDTMISNHVFAMSNRKQPRYDVQDPGFKMLNMESQFTPAYSARQKNSLRQRLRRSAKTIALPIPIPLLRKYITFAKLRAFPSLSISARDIIHEFYLSLRRDLEGRENESVPITTRQLESIIRMSQARARADLRNEVSAQDAMDVIDIVRESMIDTLSDDKGKIDFSRATGMSKSKEVRRFLAALHAEAERTSKDMFHVSDLKRVAQNIRIDLTFFNDFIDGINQQGFLLKKGRNVWQLESSMFTQH